MNLHLFNDEKVVDRTISYFEEALPGKNKYIVFLSKKKLKPKYVKSTNSVYFVKYGTNEFWQAIGNIANYNLILVHYLRIDKARFINKIEHSNIIWLGWGADIYNILLSSRGFQIYDDVKYVEKYDFGFLKRTFPFLSRMKTQLKIRTLSRAIKKINYFGGVQNDYFLLKQLFPEFSHLKYIDYFYYPIDDLLERTNLTKNNFLGKKNSIVVGNSAALSGNHFTSFKVLSEYEKCSSYKIIVPLSYGNLKYRDHLLYEGAKLFGKNFLPIKEFLPLDQYYSTIVESSFFIYANNRQEAFGNILIALYFGGKVFLKKKNPLYHYLKNIGLIIYEFDDIPSELGSILNAKECTHNKEILLERFSKSILFNTILNISTNDAE